MLKFLLGLFLGAIISLFLYACILTANKADNLIKKEEKCE